jgi:putative ABC transport system permease protein
MERSLPVPDRAAVLGDLAEEFDARARGQGIRPAHRWYRRQVRRSLVANVRGRMAEGWPSRETRPFLERRVRHSLLGGLMRDVRDALRALRAAPGFTVVALTVLTLGIGASTAIYSVVDAVVLRGLPFDDPDRIVALAETFKGKMGSGGAAPQDFLDWKARQDVFEAIAFTTGARGEFRLPDGDRSYQGLRVTAVSADLFAVLHIWPRLGHAFSHDNEIAGNEHVAVISDAFWRRQFAADPGIVGQTMRLTSGSWEIVGVMPSGFTYPIGTVPRDLWVPYVMSAAEAIRGRNMHNTYLRVVARVKSGVTVDQARVRMDQIMKGLAGQYPVWFRDMGLVVPTLKAAIVGGALQSWLLMLLGAVACVLLIASVNVANLLLARATVRSREIGIRAALGATRWQLARGLLVESLILALAGTVLGVVVAYWGVDVLRTSLPAGIPRAGLIAVNVRVLAVAALAAVATGVAFGLVPALQGSRVNLIGTLRDGGRAGTASAGRQRLRAALVIAEVSLAVVLLVGAGLFIASFARLMRIDIGLDYHQVLTVGVYPHVDTSSKVQTPLDMARAALVLGEMVERVRAIPGVEAASALDVGLPLSDELFAEAVTVPGREPPAGGDDLVDLHRITPEYPKTLRVPLLGGRLFTDADNRADGAPVVLLNDVAVARYLDGREALGATVGIEGNRTVVGVVGSVRTGGPETRVWPEAYIPLAQGGIRSGFLVIRTGQEPGALAAPITAIVSGLAPDARIGAFETLDGVFSGLVAQRRFNMLLIGLFGVLAIAIAAGGIYGVVAYLVQQRTQEIGVRMALGAVPARILQMVLGRSAAVVGIGVALGLAAAWLLARFATAFLFQVQPHDAVVYVLVSCLLLVIGLIAAFVPARRAASVDPLVALRTE